jgi:hypothetical protein
MVLALSAHLIHVGQDQASEPDSDRLGHQRLFPQSSLVSIALRIYPPLQQGLTISLLW